LQVILQVVRYYHHLFARKMTFKNQKKYKENTTKQDRKAMYITLTAAVSIVDFND